MQHSTFLLFIIKGSNDLKATHINSIIKRILQKPRETYTVVQVHVQFVYLYKYNY